MTVWNIHFSAVDSWLFKPALSPDGMGARLLASDFPPPRTTLVGALRSALGERLGADWPAYRKGKQPQIEQAIGAPDQPHPLQASVAGPWLSFDKKKLIPLPACFLAREKADGVLEVGSLTLSGSSYMTDLGEIRLPVLPEQLAGKGFRARTDIWIPESTMLELSAQLVGKNKTLSLKPGMFFRRHDLFVFDERLGIGMERSRRTVSEGLLYQTRHVRPKEKVGLMLQVHDWPEVEQADGSVVTLGADGRLAHLHVESVAEQLWPRSCTGNGLIMTTAPVPMKEKGLPAVLPGESVRAAALTKPWRRGGWDLRQHCSKPVTHWVAPGSTYWVENIRNMVLTPDIHFVEHAV